MKVKEFVKLLKYKPTSIGKDLCGIVVITFRKKNEHFPSIEFGTNEHEDGSYYFYYEIVNFGENYVDGEIIPLFVDERRKDVLNMNPKTKDDYMRAAEFINRSLKKLYSRKRNG